MKLAIIGSRGLWGVDIGEYLKKNEEHFPDGITTIVSGGAAGIDTLAAEYADAHGIPKEIYLPDYLKHGKAAPLMRNISIVENADAVLAFWDGESSGTKFTIEYAKKKRKTVITYNTVN